MPAGSIVRPQKWTNVLDLYDDGEYAAIWGNYDDDPNRGLGVRWNGVPPDIGYPNQGGNPLWYVEPDFLEHTILLSLLDRVATGNSAGNLANIYVALKECKR